MSKMPVSTLESGVLMRPPLEMASSDSHSQRSEVKYQRPTEGTPTSKEDGARFHLAKRDYQRQYFHIYSHRLNKMRPLVQEHVREQLGKDSDVKILSLCHLDQAEEGKPVVIVGTLFKNQSLKPNILNELSDEYGLLPPPPSSYVSEDDDLILEDDLQRIKLRGDIDVQGLVTGIVCGLMGQEKESGKFEVTKTFFPPLPPQIEWPVVADKDRYVVFLSGLDLKDDSSSALSSLQLAIDWIVGEAGEMSDQERMSCVQRVILAGNSLSDSTRNREEMSKAKYLTKDTEAGSISAVSLLDDLLVQLSGSVDVDVMPGEFDPANMVMPQQPMHPCLFPQASVYPTFSTVTNPCALTLEGFSLLGTSGQNTNDILRNCDLSSPLDALERLMRWAHLAPTCPDTLGCFPFNDSDPFILEALPHVLFTANQKKFDQRMFSDGNAKVKLVSVPKFSETSSIVVLNLKTMEAEEISFAAAF